MSTKRVQCPNALEWYTPLRFIGQKNYEATFKDGKEDGLWTYWYDNGQKEYEGTFKDDELISLKEWSEDGTVKKRLIKLYNYIKPHIRGVFCLWDDC